MKWILKLLGVSSGAIALLFMIYYFNLDMRLVRSVVVPLLERHYDSFANYVVFCQDCRSCIKTNMYLQSAEMYLEKLSRDDTSCPSCGGKNWTLGYPMGSRTGFVKE